MSTDAPNVFSPRILVSGYYGFGNIGDEAVLAGIVGSLRSECPDVHIAALSASPDTTCSDYGVDAVNRNHWPSIKTALRQSDLLISGGGSLLQDVTSALSPLYYLNVIRLGLQARIPVMVYAQGFGPLRRAMNRWLARRLLMGATCITVRDWDSAHALRELGINEGRITVTADPCFCVQPAEGPEIEEEMRACGLTGNDVPLVGVSLRPWVGMDTAEVAVNLTLERFCALSRCRLVFLPMHSETDTHLMCAMGRRFPQSIVVQRHLHPSEMLAVIGRLDFLIGMRLHALLFAAAMGVPMLGIGYDPKVPAFCKPLGVPVVDWDRIGSEFEGTVRGAWESRHEMAERVVAGRAALRDASRSNAAMALEVVSRVPTCCSNPDGRRFVKQL